MTNWYARVVLWIIRPALLRQRDLDRVVIRAEIEKCKEEITADAKRRESEIVPTVTGTMSKEAFLEAMEKAKQNAISEINRGKYRL